MVAFRVSGMKQRRFPSWQMETQAYHQWMNIEYNLGNHFDHLSFTVPVTGIYSFCVSVQPQPTGSNQEVRLQREGDSGVLARTKFGRTGFGFRDAINSGLGFVGPIVTPIVAAAHVATGGYFYPIFNNLHTERTNCAILQATIKLEKHDKVKIALSNGFTELNDPSRTYFEGRLISETSS